MKKTELYFTKLEDNNAFSLGTQPSELSKKQIKIEYKTDESTMGDLYLKLMFIDQDLATHHSFQDINIIRTTKLESIVYYIPCNDILNII